MKRILSQVLPLPILLFLKKLLKYKVWFRRTLSQAGQDAWVVEAFSGKKGGYFVEIGSTDGIDISNTYFLEKRYGWTGICIEPCPSFFKELQRNRSSACLNVCVDEVAGEVDFKFGGTLGGIRDHGTDNAAAEEGVQRIRAVPLSDILRDQHAPRVIDYLSVDVEGAELRVLRSFPFEEYRFLCMTIERPGEELHALLLQKGYVLVRWIPGLDSFYVHESFQEQYRTNVMRFYGWKYS